jgi:6-phosphogluconate dehydrogenase
MDKKFEIGMVGLGVMGRNLLLNMADHGYAVAGYDKDLQKVKALRQEAGQQSVQGAENMADFVALLRKPRAVMLLVPAGPVVDSVIDDLLPHLEIGDLIVDAGNSHFTDTDIRQKALEKKGLSFFGMGVSGGEYGARHGPSMMPGGPRQAYERVRQVLEASAAHVDGDPCVAYLGPGSAGHYVKMVHNGIEYGVMQLIAEAYDLMKRGLLLSDDELHEVFARWNQTEMQSYLLEITANIFQEVDQETGKRLIDVILDEAKQNGTGLWTSQSAMELRVPTPSIDVAVVMRSLSTYKTEREKLSERFEGPAHAITMDHQLFIDWLQEALFAGTLLTYAQGFTLLQRASAKYDYNLDLEQVARIWRGGCIIRASLLEGLRAIYRGRQGPAHPLHNPELAQMIQDRWESLRNVVSVAVEAGLPVPGMMAALAYLTSSSSEWLPYNLVQAQRDYFGAHTYERIDTRGEFHTQWKEE